MAQQNLTQLLEETLNDLYNPYSAFSPKPTKKTVIMFELRCQEHIAEAINQDISLAELIEWDIKDDINNCGRNAFAKFMERAEVLYLIRLTDEDGFNSCMKTLTQYIGFQLKELKK